MVRMFSRYVSPKVGLLMAMEGLLIALALICGAKVRFLTSPNEFEAYTQVPKFAFQILTVIITVEICFAYSNLYDLKAIRDRSQKIVSLGQSLGVGCVLLGMIYFVFPDLLIGRGVLLIAVFFIAGFVYANRIAMERAWQFSPLRQKVLVLGTKELAKSVARELAQRNDLALEFIGFIDPEGRAQTKAGRYPVLGSSTDLEQIVEQYQVSRIVVALEERRGTLPVRELVRLRVKGIRIDDAQSMTASLSGRIWLNTVQPSWFVFTEDGFRRSKVTLVTKRLVDIFCSVLGIIFTAPVALVIAIAIRLESKGPIIYRQTRVGLRGEHFQVLKFRSMRVDAEVNGAQWASKDDPRVTRIGKILRKYRLDELPQFLNIILGHMSFVGPRPERPEFVETLRTAISYYDERHSIRPGLTGWAQVQYSYGSSAEDAFRKMEYDLFYLKNMSVFFDLLIMLKTIRIVATGHGGQ